MIRKWGYIIDCVITLKKTFDSNLFQESRSGFNQTPPHDDHTKLSQPHKIRQDKNRYSCVRTDRVRVGVGGVRVRVGLRVRG
jgi:hypothetical protein